MIIISKQVNQSLESVINALAAFRAKYKSEENKTYFENIQAKLTLLVATVTKEAPSADEIKLIEISLDQIANDLKYIMLAAQEKMQKAVEAEVAAVPTKSTIQKTIKTTFNVVLNDLLNNALHDLYESYLTAVKGLDALRLTARYIIVDSEEKKQDVVLNGTSTWVTKHTTEKFNVLKQTVNIFVDTYAGHPFNINGASAQKLISAIENLMLKEKAPSDVEVALATMFGVAHTQFVKLLSQLDKDVKLSEAFLRDYSRLFYTFQDFNLSFKTNEVANAKGEFLDKFEEDVRNKKQQIRTDVADIKMNLSQGTANDLKNAIDRFADIKPNPPIVSLAKTGMQAGKTQYSFALFIDGVASKGKPAPKGNLVLKTDQRPALK